MRNIKDTQNFLHSKELVRHLIGICNIKLDDVVIEIGPGKGIITNELAHKARKVVWTFRLCCYKFVCQE